MLAQGLAPVVVGTGAPGIATARKGPLRVSSSEGRRLLGWHRESHVRFLSDNPPKIFRNSDKQSK